MNANRESRRMAPSGGSPPAGLDWVALEPGFFERDAQVIACDLLGTIISHRSGGGWLHARIIETEAYYRSEKASHASLGFTEKRRSLFMPPGTIYMYYARGGDSFNISCRGAGNAVLVKSGIPWAPSLAERAVPMERMQALNPLPSGARRPAHRLCAGQTLLCRSLGLRVPDWDGLLLPQPDLRIWNFPEIAGNVVRTRRLGIPPGRDEHLPYRFVLASQTASSTRNPIPRSARAGVDYELLDGPAKLESFTRRTNHWERVLGLPPSNP